MAERGEQFARMKINWFSPVPPTLSSIAMDTAAVLPALSEKAEVVLWVHEKEWSRTLEQYARVRHYDPKEMPWAEINAADFTFYHLGNHPDFHGPIWEVSRQHPGIVVLHDLGLQHFFAGLAMRKTLITESDYTRMMAFHHPGNGRETAEAFLAGQRSASEICDEFPLTGAGIENALGVVVHTEVGYSRLAYCTDIPVAYVPLFAPPETVCENAGPLVRLPNLESPDDPYQIIIFGFLGFNRRLLPFLRALHDFEERDRFHVDIYGAVEDEDAIRRAIQELGLERPVTIHGFADEADLNAALDRSHLAINLRDPTMGEASASQLRIWQHELPSLVTEIGWYATLPENTVAKVRRDFEQEDIQRHLRDFLRAPELYQEIGRNGRRHVDEHHTVDAYVEGLLALAEETIDSGPREAVSWVAGRAGQLIKPWFKEEAADILVPRLSATISHLFDERESTR